MRPLLALLAVGVLALPGTYAQAPPTVDASPFGFSCDNQTTHTLEGYCPRMTAAATTQGQRRRDGGASPAGGSEPCA